MLNLNQQARRFLLMLGACLAVSFIAGAMVFADWMQWTMVAKE
jgi:hypothetical protein